MICIESLFVIFYYTNAIYVYGREDENHLIVYELFNGFP